MIYIATIAWAGLIFYGSSLPGSTLPAAPEMTSFLVHFFEYVILGALMFKSSITLSQRMQRSLGKLGTTIILMVGFLYAVSDEVHQLFVLGRHFDPMDLLVDFIGLMTGMLVVALKYHDILVKKQEK